MASKKEKDSTEKQVSDKDFVADLISDLNRESQSRIAWNLDTDLSPTHIKRWISTGCTSLDYIISNRTNGGLPEGRVVEIFGPPSIGKSHLAIQIAKSAQKMNGVVVYIDTENGSSPENLASLGLDVSKKFIYVEPSYIEEVFKVMESVITKVKATQKDTPVVIVWDSVAGTPPKAELEGDYTDNSIGLAARQLGKGFRKITQLIGNQNVLMVCLNQTRIKIGVMHGDPTTTSGGLALPFHASVRIQLFGGSKILDEKTGETIGINVKAKTIKNKVSAPHREAEFELHFGKGLYDHEQLFDRIRQYCDENTVVDDDGTTYEMSGTAAWKTFLVKDKTGKVLFEKKFTKKNIREDVMQNKECSKYFTTLLDKVFIKKHVAIEDEVSEVADVS